MNEWNMKVRVSRNTVDLGDVEGSWEKELEAGFGAIKEIFKPLPTRSLFLNMLSTDNLCFGIILKNDLK